MQNKMAALDASVKSANEILGVLCDANLIPSFESIKQLYNTEDLIRRNNLKDAKAIIQDLQDVYRSTEDKASSLGQGDWSQDAFEV